MEADRHPKLHGNCRDIYWGLDALWSGNDPFGGCSLDRNHPVAEIAGGTSDLSRGSPHRSGGTQLEVSRLRCIDTHGPCSAVISLEALTDCKATAEPRWARCES